MGLLEFLRQWQRGRLAAGVAASVVLHLALVAAILWGRHALPARVDVKRGEPLIVELPQAPDSPPPGLGGLPAPSQQPSMAAPPTPPAPRAPTAPKVAAAPPAPPAKPVAKPPAPRPAPAGPRPVEPAPRPVEPAPREPEQSVASTAPREPEPTPAPAVPAPSPAAATPPAPPKPAPQVERPPDTGPRPSERQVASVPPSPPAPAGPNLLAAMRRGGSGGGAGGSGQGRAGIEGEPIPLDSQDPKYTDYLDQVRRRIKSKWGYPCEKNEQTRVCEYRSTQLIIEFGIAKSGELVFVSLVRTSGHPIYDDYALNAVKLASPYPPIPDSFSKKGVPIHATFSYVLQSSLTNILR
jgi:TonB family protein